MIKGKLVELRQIGKQDFENEYRWRNDEELARFTGGHKAVFINNTPIEAIDGAYSKDLNPLDKRDHCTFSVYELGTEKHIGRCDYRDVNPIIRSADIGVAIGDRDYWNHGYGTDAVKTLVGYLFNTLNLQRVQLDTWSGNKRAIRCYEKCGFQIEGRLRNAEYVDGTFYDSIVMGLLREEHIG